MASTRRPSRHDWAQPLEPLGMAKWIADHRVLTRLILLAIDATVLILLIENLRSSSRHWPTVVVFIVWLGLTANAGWLIPKQVDTWRQRQRSAPDSN